MYYYYRPEEARVSGEAMALAGVFDALRWRHVLEKDVAKEPGQRVIIYPRTLAKLGLVLKTGMDEQSELWPLYEAVVIEQDTWQDHCRPTVVSEDDPRLDTRREWMEEAKLMAADSYRLVLEDSPEVEAPKNSPDQSSDDHGDVLEWTRTPRKCSTRRDSLFWRGQ
jgi:hypothetical protein